MLRINLNWERPEVPEYNEEIHNPEKVFALLCYRGVYYAKWVVMNPFKKWEQYKIGWEWK
jgi:hypothetical protein